LTAAEGDPQVQVEGYWVAVETNGQEYDYRGRGVGDFSLCASPREKRQPGREAPEY